MSYLRGPMTGAEIKRARMAANGEASDARRTHHERDHGALVALNYGIARSPRWHSVAMAHLAKQPHRVACKPGARVAVQVHHIFPFTTACASGDRTSSSTSATSSRCARAARTITCCSGTSMTSSPPISR
jgi:hypothetical protein